MIGLFDRDWRRSYPLDQIESIVDANKGGGSDRCYKLMMKGDSVSTDLNSYTYDRLMGRPVQLITAEAGIHALGISTDDGEQHLHKSPVIAWALCFDGSIRVVTPAGVDDGHMWSEGGGYVLMPDGSVQSVGEYLDVIAFENIDAYLAAHTSKTVEARGEQA